MEKVGAVRACVRVLVGLCLCLRACMHKETTLTEQVKKSERLLIVFKRREARSAAIEGGATGLVCSGFFLLSFSPFCYCCCFWS